MAIYVFIDITMKRSFDGIALPRLPGAYRLDDTVERDVIVRLAEDGVVKIKGVEYDGGGLREVLLKYADWRRDLMRPMTPTLVRLALGAHRDAPWTAAEAVLRRAASPGIVYESAVVVSEEKEFEWRGVAVRLTERRVEQIRYEEPRVTVVVGRAPGTGSGLLAALRALPAERFESGVRARLASDLRSGDALRALVVIAAVEPEVIVVETVDDAPEELLVDGRPVAAAEGPLGDLGEVVVPLAFEYRFSRK